MFPVDNSGLTQLLGISTRSQDGSINSTPKYLRCSLVSSIMDYLFQLMAHFPNLSTASAMEIHCTYLWGQIKSL